MVNEMDVPNAENVTVGHHALTVELSDGRTVSVPPAWYPRLVDATANELSDWRLIGKGQGIHWQDLDEDISVGGLLAGRPSGESQASFRRWIAGRRAATAPAGMTSALTRTDPSISRRGRPVVFTSDVHSHPDLVLAKVPASEANRVTEAHDLLREALGDVEDLDSFRRTVSPDTDAGVTPKLLCALLEGRVVGSVVAVYLRNLNAGMILYAAVAEPFRRRGIYTRLRKRAIRLLDEEASRRAKDARGSIDYLLSEQVVCSTLYQHYLWAWDAYVAPCRWEQPGVQGLAPRRLALLVQPVAKKRRPTANETAMIVREVYEKIYRLPEPERSPEFRRIMRSLARDPSPDGTGHK